jgi:hypothetical protein
MWKLPHGDEPYTIRVDAFAIGEFLDSFDRSADNATKWKELKQLKEGEQWFDFDFRGDELIRFTRVNRNIVPGNVDKRRFIDNPSLGFKSAFLDEVVSCQAWWEKGNCLYHRVEPKSISDAVAFISEAFSTSSCSR